MGAAYLAGLAVGYWESKEDVIKNWAIDQTFEPKIDDEQRSKMIKGWNTNADGTYYFDPITGAMAKGTTTIDGMTYYFDPATGVKR